METSLDPSAGKWGGNASGATLLPLDDDGFEVEAIELPSGVGHIPPPWHLREWRCCRLGWI